MNIINDREKIILCNILTDIRQVCTFDSNIFEERSFRKICLKNFAKCFEICDSKGEKYQEWLFDFDQMYAASQELQQQQQKKKMKEEKVLIPMKSAQLVRWPRRRQKV